MEPKRSQKKSAGAAIAQVGAIIFVVGLLFCAFMYVVAPKNNPDAGFLEGLMVIVVGLPILVVGFAVFLIGLLMQFTKRWNRNFRIRNQRKPGDRVRHLTFGEGVVLRSEIVEDVEFVDVQFQEKFGKKRLPMGSPILEKL